MNWVDWAIVVIIAVSSLISLKRGFVKEALSLLTWVAAFIVARVFTDNLSVLLVDYISTPSFRVATAFAILFIATLIIGALVNNLIGFLVQATGLSGTDRVLGMAFGVARGGVLVIVAIALLKLTPATQDIWWQQSSLIPHFALMEEWSQQVAIDLSTTILNIGR